MIVDGGARVRRAGDCGPVPAVIDDGFVDNFDCVPATDVGIVVVVVVVVAVVVVNDFFGVSAAIVEVTAGLVLVGVDLIPIVAADDDNDDDKVDLLTWFTINPETDFLTAVTFGNFAGDFAVVLKNTGRD